MSSKEWVYINSSEFCQKIADGTHDSPKRKEEGKPLVTSKHIKGYNIDFENTYLISEEDFTKINLRSKVDQWDLLISMIGEYCGFCYVERNTNIDYAVKNVGILKTGDKIKALWLYYYFNSPIGKELIKSLRSGTSQPYLSLTALRSLQILVPKSAKKMERIVTVLSSLDDKIELNRQTNQTLEGIAQNLYKEWFVNFNYPNATGEMQDSELGQIPKGWKVYKINDLVDSVSETFKFKKEQEVIFLNTSDIEKGSILHNNYSSPSKLPGQAKKKIKKFDILFTEIRPANKRYALIDFEADNFVVSTKLMVLRAKAFVSSIFVYNFLTNENTLSILQHLAESRSGTFPQITFDILGKLKIALPNTEKLLKDYEKLAWLIFESTKISNQQTQTLSQLRDTLLPKLMRGEIEV